MNRLLKLEKNVATKYSDEQKILEALRRAMVGPVKLCGKPAASYLFSDKDKLLAQQAIAEKLLEKVEAKEPFGKQGKSKIVDYGRITEKGREYVLDNDSPKAVLTDLCRVMESQAVEIHNLRAQAAGWQENIQAAFRETLEQQINGAVRVFEQHVGGQLSEWRKHVEQLDKTVQSVEAVVRSVAQRPVVATPSERDSHSTKRNELAWLDDVLKMATEHREQRRFPSLTLPEIYDRLQSSYPGLTLGQFHDGLRTLRDKRRIRLEPFTQALATLNDPRNALYLDREVKYYVDLP